MQPTRLIAAIAATVTLGGGVAVAAIGEPAPAPATATVAAGSSALADGHDGADPVPAPSPSTTVAVEAAEDLAGPTTTTTAAPPAAGLADDPGATAPGPVVDPASTVVEIHTGDPQPLPPAVPEQEIGGVHGSSAIPEGIGFVDFGGPAPAPQEESGGSGGGGGGAGFGGPGALVAGAGCAADCITSGIAYARGFGAQLEVTTSVPAELFLSVIGDEDGDGEWDYTAHEWTDGPVTEHHWALDDLQAGRTYHAMVAATDQYGTSHAFGELTTLSTRTVHVAVDGIEITGGPQNVIETRTHLLVGGDYRHEVSLGAWSFINPLANLVDLDVLVTRGWPSGDPCEVHQPWNLTPQGDSDSACMSWNTATATVDLAQGPAGADRWTTVDLDATAAVPAGDGALPPGYGQPRYFDLVADISVHIVYS